MLTTTIRTNLRCNLGCGFCHARAAQDDPRQHAAPVIEAAIDEALAGGAEELVFTGGEPLLCAELEGWIRRVTATGARALVETNGTLLAVDDRAAALREAGLGRIRVGVNGWGAQADAIARLKGAWGWTAKGIEAAQRVGLEVEISLALDALNLGRAAGLPHQLNAAFPSLHALLLRFVSEAPAAHLAPWSALAAAAVHIATACRAVKLPLSVDPRHSLPWCALPHRRRWPELLGPSGGDGGGRDGRAPVCNDCAVRDVCPGLPTQHLARFGSQGLRPVGEADVRLIHSLSDRRQSLAEAELSADQWFGGPQADGQVERVIRILFHCNQNCAFCFVDRDLPAAPPARIRAEIQRAAEEGVALLSLSGGEPTLDPNLASYVAQASDLGLRVRLQTNALRCARPGVAAELAAAGLGEAFVSLHAADAGRSDAITGAPQTHDSTLAGIDALVAAGVAVQVNCVVTGGNVDGLQAVVKLVAERWRQAVIFTLSWAHASSGLVPVSEAVTPRFSDVRAEVAAAIAACGQLGVRFRGLDGQCGLPLCFAEPGWLDRDRLPTLPQRLLSGFDKAPGCADCAFDDRCVGVRSGYARLYGLGELRPVRPVGS